MTGNAETAAAVSSRRIARLREHRYVLADGGEGARLVSMLQHEPRLAAEPSPRHADLLIVVEPVTRKFVPAVAELYRAVPRPRAAIVVGESSTRLPTAEVVRLEEVIPGVQRVAADDSLLESIVRAAEQRRSADGPNTNRWRLEPATVPLPPKHERELATELVVLSLGPVQPFAAGPLRVLLVCDGEHVVSASVDAGYARRGIADAMPAASWPAAAELASELDLLAPVAGRLAYVEAVERLMGYEADPMTSATRYAALELERAENAMWWLERFSTVLGHDDLSSTAYELASALAGTTSAVWRESPEAWLVPRGGTPGINDGEYRCLAEQGTAVELLRRRVERDAFIRSRLQRVGVLSADRAREAGVSGPVLQASAEGTGDSWARLLTRLRSATADLERAVTALASARSERTDRAPWNVPAGDARAVVGGPRGELAVYLVSDGGEQPVAVGSRPGRRRPCSRSCLSSSRISASQTPKSSWRAWISPWRRPTDEPRGGRRAHPLAADGRRVRCRRP